MPSRSPCTSDTSSNRADALARDRSRALGPGTATACGSGAARASSIAQEIAYYGALELVGGEHVADLGAGGGYFTFRLASAVGRSGRVYAIDLDGALLAYVASQARARDLSQITTVRATESETRLSDGSVDLIFLSNVFHHLPAPPSYFARLRPALRSGGRIAIVEATPESAHGSHGTAPEAIAAAMQEAGFVRVASHGFLPHQSYQVFEPSAR